MTVSDRRGMSYYSDRAVYKHINVENIFPVRQELIDADLIVYAKPIYQVLSLPKKRVLPINKEQTSNYETPASKEETAAFFNKYRRKLR